MDKLVGRQSSIDGLLITQQLPSLALRACVTCQSKIDDPLERYREIVRRVVEDYASYKPSNGDIDTEAIIDPVRDHYEVMHSGWDGMRRVHGSVIHLDIRGGKVWLQYDGTNRPVADELLAAGIPAEDIVLAFHPPKLRPLTGFGVG